MQCSENWKTGENRIDDIARKSHKHGAKAEKRGISSEYVCICTGIQHNGDAYTATVNRAKMDAEEPSTVFASHIADGTLVLCDVLRSYNALPAITNCTVKDCTQMAEDEKCFYHLNTVNGFHSNKAAGEVGLLAL